MKHLLSAAALAAAVLAAPAYANNYALDPTHTFVVYEIGHFGTSTNRGRFEKKEGTVQFDRAAKSGKVEISFELGSVDSGVDMLDKHLQSADIFDVEKFPTAKFVSDKFVFDGDKLKEVTGQLTLKGKTAPMTIKANKFTCYESPMLQKREVCGGDFEATIDRTQWGLDYGIAYGFPKNVRLVLQIEAVKQ